MLRSEGPVSNGIGADYGSSPSLLSSSGSPIECERDLEIRERRHREARGLPFDHFCNFALISYGSRKINLEK